MSARDDLAQDYVLGLLEAGEAAALEARLSAPVTVDNHALALAVALFRDRMLPLDLTAPELPLAPGAWDRLDAALGSQAAELPPGLSLPEVAPNRRWRLTALTSMAAAALLAVALGWQVVRTLDPAVLVVLLDQSGAPVALLEASADNRVLVTPLVGIEPGPTQVLQLWTKPDPAGPPVSVGLLEAAARMVIDNRALPSPVAGQLYEITVEPEGGSPTGRPTGAVFGVGNAQVPVLN